MERIIYKHVVLIGIDGMGNFCKNTETPNIDRIFENGAVSYNALSMDPTISAENWGAMLLGSTPLVHGLTNEIVSTTLYNNKNLPSVFKRIRNEKHDAKLASFVNWNPINNGIIEHDIGVSLVTADSDDELTEKIVEYVKEKPDYLFIQFDQVDGAGHKNGYGTKGHLERISKTDEFVGRIFDAYCSEGIIDDTLFIVTADHGGKRRSHGGYSDSEKYVFFGARGKGIEKSEAGYMQTRDMAALVLYALGMNVPEYDESGFTSQVPNGIFTFYNGSFKRVKAVPHLPAPKETPLYCSENGLKAFFPEERIKLAMFMDNCIKDETGKCTFKEYGTIKYYSDGVRSSRAELGSTGFAEVSGIRFGNDSFTIALWLKIDRSTPEETVVLGNKDWWHQKDGDGFVLLLRCADTLFNLRYNDEDFELITPFPENISDGWVHITISVDKVNKVGSLYYNFSLVHRRPILDEQIGVADALPLFIGNDGKGEYNNIAHSFFFSMDDLFIFDGAFNENDVKKLSEYYA